MFAAYNLLFYVMGFMLRNIFPVHTVRKKISRIPLKTTNTKGCELSLTFHKNLWEAYHLPKVVET